MSRTDATPLDTFAPFPKIPRLRRDIVVTEKIDGTNAQVVIQIVSPAVKCDTDDVITIGDRTYVRHDGDVYEVRFASRNRWIKPDDDNAGFAKWGVANARELLGLGAGRHYGEWWGSGIQRGYGFTKGERFFSLFNTGRWNWETPESTPPLCCTTVPVLAEGVMTDALIEGAINDLIREGSNASIGYMRPEGVVVYHTQSRSYYKRLIENDEIPKGADGGN